MIRLVIVTLVLALFAVHPGRAVKTAVVVNEIFYNAPDDVDDLQWVELYNTSDEAIELGGWTLNEGKVYTFPATTRLGGKQFLVVALSPERFAKVYGTTAQGPFRRPLKRGGEKLVLADATSVVRDTVVYKDRPPWPVSADGYSASLERICPTANGESADNWSGSPLPATLKPAGTPGQANASYSAQPLPTVTLRDAPTDLLPAQPLVVVADVGGEVKEVTLLCTVIRTGIPGEETSLPMVKGSEGQYTASIPGEASGSLIRYRVKVRGAGETVRYCPAEQDLRPRRSAYVHEKFDSANLPLGFVLRGGQDRIVEKPPERPGFLPPGGFTGRGPKPNLAAFGARTAVARPPRGASTFIYVEPKTGKVEVFDYISAVPRIGDRGFRLFFHKDHRLDGMASVNLVFEGSEWSLMAEALANDVYRRAGSVAPLTEFVRVWVDGQLAGHHLMVERPNRSFLRRHQIDDRGNLYKLIWSGRGLVGQHEKQTNEQTGHEDLVALVDQLTKTRSDANKQWEVIQKHFDVNQVATYFAVNTILSHWDGFFNNYCAYHDPKRDKWIMIPWDQDKTWGYYDGLPDDQVFVDMPLSYGREGDRPPRPAAGMLRVNWWRPGGHFSRPLLANPHFRKIYLARMRELLDQVYTQEVYFPLIDAMAKRLGEDYAIRAKLRGDGEAAGARLVARDADLLKLHLVKRRQYLLEQPELAGR